MDTQNPDPLFERVPIDPEIKKWALEQFSEEELFAGLEEIRQTGGLQIQDLLAVFDEVATKDERAA